MELKKGDLIVTLLKVERISAIVGQLKADMMGVVTETNPRFNNMKVYGVLIDGKEYYLFEDEIKKWEGE